MGRLGFKPDELMRSCREMAQSNVSIVGLLTHFASADSTAAMATDRQLRVFKKTRYHGVDRSASNSAAILTRRDCDFQWVRPGLMLYGADPMVYQSTSSGEHDHGLQPAMRVTAPVIAVRELKRGDRIGYGGTYECKSDTKIAIVGAGYGDGYPRTVSPGTCVVLGNRRVPIVGRVSMDSMSVDITALSVSPPLDYPVTLWGHESLRVDEVADRVGTIPYELLCSIRGRRSWHDPATEVNVRPLK
jgi:alanine racemase